MNVWMTARGAGLAALILPTLSTCLGALVSRHAKPARRYLVQYLHRATAGLGLGVLVLHVVTVLMDTYAKVGWRGAVVPFTAGYRPTWTGLGTLAVYVFLGVSLLGLARGRMAASPRGARIWRGLHMSAYLGWAMAMLHGFNSGSDSGVAWVRGLYVGSLVAVVASVVYRVRQVRHHGALRRHDRLGLGRPAPVHVLGAPPRTAPRTPAATRPLVPQGAPR